VFGTVVRADGTPAAGVGSCFQADRRWSHDLRIDTMCG